MPFKTFGTEMLSSGDVDTYLMRQAMIRVDSGSKPSVPATGTHIWETDTLREQVYNGSTWDYTNEFRAATKPSNETVNNSISLQNDDHLFFTLPGDNSVWVIEGHILYSGATTGMDFSWDCEGTNSGSPELTSWITVDQSVTTNDSVNISVDTGAFRVSPAFTSVTCIYLRGFASNPRPTPVTINFQWAQATATVGNLTVFAGSILYAYRIA